MSLAPPPVRTSAQGAKVSAATLVAVLVVVGIGVLSFLSPGTKVLLHTKGRLHSWGHLFAFGSVVFVLLNASKTRLTRMLSVVATLLFGALIEIGQHIVYRTPLETSDMLVDMLGVILGCIVAGCVVNLRSKDPHSLLN